QLDLLLNRRIDLAGCRLRQLLLAEGAHGRRRGLGSLRDPRLTPLGGLRDGGLIGELLHADDVAGRASEPDAFLDPGQRRLGDVAKVRQPRGGRGGAWYPRRHVHGAESGVIGHSGLHGVDAGSALTSDQVRDVAETESLSYAAVSLSGLLGRP